MLLLAISGAGIGVGFRLDVSAVIVLLATNCFGRSPAAVSSTAVLGSVTVALSGAGSLIELVALWQLSAFLVWSLALCFSDEEVQAWVGRLLISGWVMDAVLVAAAVALPAVTGADTENAGPRIVAWGCALSLACRIGVLPVGAHSLWNKSPREAAVSWTLLMIVPAAILMGRRLIETLGGVPETRLAISQFLILAAVAAGIASVRQESSVRESAWRISAVLAGAVAIALFLSPFSGFLVWTIACVAVAIVVPRVAGTPPEQMAPAAGDNALGRLERAAANEWGLPGAWKFFVAMPLRGASQVLRFVDGFAFEQAPARALRRMAGATSAVVPEPFGRLLEPTAAVLAFLVLLALAFR